MTKQSEHILPTAKSGISDCGTLFSRLLLPLAFTFLIIAYGSIWALNDLNETTLGLIWFVPLVGIFGALVANSSGVGGGVVFIPVFMILGAQGNITITAATIVGVSFLIQSFGMTTGSLSWIKRLIDHQKSDLAGVPRNQFLAIVLVSLLGALPAMLITQWYNVFTQEQALYLFKGFSLLLGLALLIANITGVRDPAVRTSVHKADLIILFLLSILGGVATALFSVGVGELMALYLFLRHYPITTAVAPAVIVSAISVIIGSIHHIVAGTVLWEIVVLAVPGAMIGAWLARRLAIAIRLRTLKLFTALWIIVSSSWLIVSNI